MIYELRTYTAAPGKLQRLHQRFRDVTIELFRKHGMQVIGFWTPVGQDADDGDLLYLLAYPSKEAGAAAWRAFRADDAWIAAKAASEVDGPLTTNIASLFLDATAYSPLT